MKKLVKTKIKNIVCSLALAFIMIIGANYSLTSLAIDGLKNWSFAEYKPSSVSPAPYNFKQDSGWDINSEIKNLPTEQKNIFTYSNSFDLSKAPTEGKEALKPSTLYDGTSTTLADGESVGDKDYKVMMLESAGNANMIMVNKKDEDGKIVFQTEADGTFKYVTVDGSSEKKEFSQEEKDADKNNADFYELKPETTNVYYKKIAEQTAVTYFYTTKSSYSLSLSANSYYVLTFWVWTKNAEASVYATGTKFDAKIQEFESNEKWTQYYLFIATDEKATVNLSIYYGNKESCEINTNPGVVYIDNIDVRKISETDFNNKEVTGEEISAEAIKQEYNPKFYTHLIASLNNINSNFENDLTIYDKMYGQNDYDKDAAILRAYQYYINQYKEGSTTEKLDEDQFANLYRAYSEKLTVSKVLESEEFKTEKEVEGAEGEDPTTETVPGPSTFNKNNNILKIENTSQKYNLGLLSAPLPVQQFSHYKLTINLKGLSDEDTATIKLISYILTGDNDTEGSIQTVENSKIDTYVTDSDITNNWKSVSFVIQGNSFANKTFQIAIIAEKESTIYVDNIKYESISAKAYLDSSDKKLDLSPSSTTISKGITNGYFNNISSEEADPTKLEAPYKPATWVDLSNDMSKDVTAGIISTVEDATHYNAVKSKIGNPANPIGKDELGIDLPKTNILAIYSPKMDDETVKHTYGYKTPTSSSGLTSLSGVYKITLQVYASNTTGENANFSGTIFANLKLSDKTISSIETKFDEANSYLNKGKWIEYTFIVRTGSTSRSIVLELGVKEAIGTAFFQKVGYTKLADKTVDGEKITVDTQYKELEEQYGSIKKQKDNYVRLVNFDGNSFVMHSEEKVEGKDYYSSLSHSLREPGKDEDPIVQGELGVIDTEELVNYALSGSNNKFALKIHNEDSHYTLVNPNVTTTLSSSSYYAINLYVKTENIANENGLNIVMDKISATFANINTENSSFGDLTSTNGYKKFTVLVKTGSSTISGLKIYYELGTEANKFAGSAYIADLEITKLKDESAFDELKSSVSEINDGSVIIKDFTTPASASTTDEEVDSLTLATFFLVFSSILLVAVLVFAIVSVYIKKSPKAKTITGTNNANVATKKDSEISDKDGFV